MYASFTIPTRKDKNYSSLYKLFPLRPKGQGLCLLGICVSKETEPLVNSINLKTTISVQLKSRYNFLINHKHVFTKAQCVISISEHHKIILKYTDMGIIGNCFSLSPIHFTCNKHTRPSKPSNEFPDLFRYNKTLFIWSDSLISEHYHRVISHKVL